MQTKVCSVINISNRSEKTRIRELSDYAQDVPLGMRLVNSPHVSCTPSGSNLLSVRSYERWRIVVIFLQGRAELARLNNVLVWA